MKIEANRAITPLRSGRGELGAEGTSGRWISCSCDPALALAASSSAARACSWLICAATVGSVAARARSEAIWSLMSDSAVAVWARWDAACWLRKARATA